MALSKKYPIISVTAIDSLVGVNLFIRNISGYHAASGNVTTIKDATSGNVLFTNKAAAAATSFSQDYHYPLLAAGIKVTTLAGTGSFVYIQTE